MIMSFEELWIWQEPMGRFYLSTAPSEKELLGGEWNSLGFKES